MSKKLVWDATGEKKFETGVKKGVLYPQVEGAYPKGYAWNGLTAVNENPSGAEATALWANDAKYGNLYSNEEFAATVEAFTYPKEFEACDGSKELAPGVYIGQQERQPFGLSYVTTIGNDTEGLNHGYKIHLIYGAVAAPSAKDHSTVNESPEAMTMSWELSTTPVAVTGAKPTAHLVIDSTVVEAEKLALIEAALYGTDEAEAYLPTPDQVAAIIKGEAA
ncbi:MAG: hypothetical protein IKZ08_02735 [Bacteroidales bacterium]|nr:hypothetical protein [Bacteroidales bacterium]